MLRRLNKICRLKLICRTKNDLSSKTDSWNKNYPSIKTDSCNLNDTPSKTASSNKNAPLIRRVKLIRGTKMICRNKNYPSNKTDPWNKNIRRKKMSYIVANNMIASNIFGSNSICPSPSRCLLLFQTTWTTWRMRCTCWPIQPLPLGLGRGFSDLFYGQNRPHWAWFGPTTAFSRAYWNT